MRLLIVIALLVGAAFITLLVLTDLARELSRRSFQAPPDLDDSDDWDIASDESAGTTTPVAHCAERRAVTPYAIGRMRGQDVPGSANALDDLRSAL
jgi:hypothetical protein